MSAVEVCALDIAYPDAAARRRAAASGYRAAASIHLECADGTREDIELPVRVARAVADEPPALPASHDEVFAALAAIEACVCFAVTVDLLSRRDHAEEELSRKLKRSGYRRPAIDAAIARARENRFVDNDRFAAYFIEERKRQGWGKRRIELELSRRGIRSEDVPGYPEEFFSDEDDLERACALLARKSVPGMHARDKLMRFLVSKGFSYGIAADAVRRRLDGSEDERDLW